MMNYYNVAIIRTSEDYRCRKKYMVFFCEEELRNNGLNT